MYIYMDMVKLYAYRLSTEKFYSSRILYIGQVKTFFF